MTLIGHQLGVYRIDRELGRGGMGVVYEAEDLALRRVVALKVLAPNLTDDASARARFQQEIKAAVAIEHPHVVPVYNAGYEDGHFFLATRFIGGRDLWHLLHHGGPLTEARALRLVGQIASALFAVHEQGLIHRDIKPQNVLIWHPDHSDEHAFLTDFGISRALHETRGLTRAGALGTPGYMAPELLRGERATPACDQYSLACLAFELLTGRLPFDDDAVEGDPPLPGVLFAPQTSKRVRETIERALAPSPTDRFPDVRAFVMSSDAAAGAFEEGREINATLSSARSESQRVTGLSTNLGLTDERIAEITKMQRSEVVRLRRKAARRSIVGE
jgi:serine/threonine-protein kinase